MRIDKTRRDTISRIQTEKNNSMNRFFLKSCLLIAITAIIFTACSKENTVPDSPLNGKTTAEFNPDLTYGIMTDRDGNVYKTITIGTQTWMAENLRTTKYNDGTAIPNITSNEKWGALTTGAYCNYDNTTNTDTIATFGRLYNWYAVNTGKLAPTGWHIPTDAEWTTLITYLGGMFIAYDKLKETGTTHWVQNTGANNESGFTALPGGRCYYDGTFKNVNFGGYWWSFTEYDINRALGLYVHSSNCGVIRFNDNKKIGFSVRCVRD